MISGLSPTRKMSDRITRSSARLSRSSSGVLTKYRFRHRRPSVRPKPLPNYRLPRAFKANFKKPLSKLESVAHIPLFDVEGYINRSIETRKQDLSGPTRKIKRPSNAFFLYRKAHHDRAAAVEQMLCKGASQEPRISVVIGESWRMETKAVKERFSALAEADAMRHREAFPNYQFKPTARPRSPSYFPAYESELSLSSSSSTSDLDLELGTAQPEVPLQEPIREEPVRKEPRPELEAFGNNLYNSMYAQYLEQELANSRHEIKRLTHKVVTLQDKLSVPDMMARGSSQGFPAGFNLDTVISPQPHMTYDTALSSQVSVDELVRPLEEYPVDPQLFDAPDESVHPLGPLKSAPKVSAADMGMFSSGFVPESPYPSIGTSLSEPGLYGDMGVFSASSSFGLGDPLPPMGMDSSLHNPAIPYADMALGVLPFGSENPYPNTGVGLSGSPPEIPPADMALDVPEFVPGNSHSGVCSDSLPFHPEGQLPDTGLDVLPFTYENPFSDMDMDFLASFPEFPLDDADIAGIWEPDTGSSS